MGGQGFSFKIKMATADSTDRQHFFKIEKIDIDLKNLNIKLKKSKYKLPFTIFKPILFRVLRPVIQKVIEKQLRDSVTQADALAYSIHQEAQVSARRSNDMSPQNFYQRYYQATQKRFLQGKEKTKKTADGRKVNIAVTAHDSLFPDIKLPGGISTKATEYNDLATTGNKWESPVFGIGTAKESTNIPPLGQIQRRSPNTGPAGVRGPQNAGPQGQPNFSSQVDQSFGTPQDLSLSQNRGPRANGTLNSATDLSTMSGPSHGYAPTSGGGAVGSSTYGTAQTTSGVSMDAAHTTLANTGGTLLGANNPVLQGAA